MSIAELIEDLGDEVTDSDEESFLLFSQKMPSHDLGFVDPKVDTLGFSIGGRDLVVRQSPTILSSHRRGGTTGAVVWKISPLFANWITLPDNVLFHRSILQHDSVVLELGCGISGLIGLALAPKVRRYIATDQEYILKILRQNLHQIVSEATPTKVSRLGRKSKLKSSSQPEPQAGVEVLSLDWESSSMDDLPAILGDSSDGIDAILSCDCIYNETLLEPFIRTCAEICRLRQVSKERPTICIVAQQLRSSIVFEEWLAKFHEFFRVWRLPDSLLGKDLKSDSGFVIHLGILREATI